MPLLSTSAIFFPGIVFHEFSHYLACKFLSVKVLDVKWFSTSEAYVTHAIPNAWKSTVISTAPFLLGTAFALLLLDHANSILSSFNPIILLFYWFAISILYYSFPSDHDTKNAFNSILSLYKIKIIGKSKLITKLFYIISIPFIFIPAILILGFMLLFEYSAFLRILWILAIILFSFNPGHTFALIAFIDILFKTIVRLFI